VLHFDARLGGQVVEVENLAVGAFNGDARMALALVFDDDELGLATLSAFALFLEARSFAFFDIFVANDAGLLSQNWRDVRIPDHQLLPWLDLLAVSDEHRRAVRHLVFLELAPLSIDNDN